MDANVGPKHSGKPFTRKSDFIDYCIMKIGSDLTGTENEGLLLNRLRDEYMELKKLREKHQREEGISEILSEYYGIPPDQPMQLAAKVKADFSEHQTLCPNCEIREERDSQGHLTARCPEANSGRACWRVKPRVAGGLPRVALITDAKDIFPAIYAGFEIKEVERRIKDLEVRMANRQADGQEKSSYSM